MDHLFASELYDRDGQYAGSYVFYYDEAQGRYLKIACLDDNPDDGRHTRDVAINRVRRGCADAGGGDQAGDAGNNAAADTAGR